MVAIDKAPPFPYDQKMKMLTPFPNYKYPVILDDGFVVEAVYYGSGTLCISSQAGCALSCPFCSSGRQGLKRQLTSAEMHQQIDALRMTGQEPRRLTISGIGEPLHNWKNVRQFMVDCQKQGADISVTTTGVSLQKLEELIELSTNGVMISLHAARPDVHQRLIPNGPDFQSLCSEIDRIYPIISRRKRRKTGINYLLLNGENDSDNDLISLQRLLHHWPDFTLHLLRYNPVAGAVYSSDPQKIEDWYNCLKTSGIQVRRSNRWRNQEDGGCGTLFLQSQHEKEICK